MKFEIKNLEAGGYKLYQQSNENSHLITLGNIYLKKEYNKNELCCYQFETCFNYHGIKKALCGKNNFIPKRIVVIQMI